MEFVKDTFACKEPVKPDTAVADKIMVRCLYKQWRQAISHMVLSPEHICFIPENFRSEIAFGSPRYRFRGINKRGAAVDGRSPDSQAWYFVAELGSESRIGKGSQVLAGHLASCAVADHKNIIRIKPILSGMACYPMENAIYIVKLFRKYSFRGQAVIEIDECKTLPGKARP